MPWRGRVSINENCKTNEGLTSEFFFCPAIGREGGDVVRETYLDLIGDDGTRAKLCADLVCANGIKVYEAESFDVSVALHILEIA